MGVRFVKFGSTYVNPSRVLFVTDVYAQGEIDVGTSTPIKTGTPISKVIKMLEDAMGNQPNPPEPVHYPPERAPVHKAVLADMVEYLEGKLEKTERRKS